MSVTLLYPVLQAAGLEQAPSQAQAQAALAQMQAQAAAHSAIDRAQIARDMAMTQRDLARANREMQMMQPAMDGRHARQREGMFFVGFLVVVMAAVAIFRPLVRGFARRLEGSPARDVFAAQGSAERLERIEQAVEAMAVEIERISEGQRFTTKLLSGRAEADASLVRRV